MGKNFLVVENISKSFGENKVLENINLDISKSEFFGLLGSSGSGKTTLLRILGGFEKPDTGRVILDGVDITNLEPFDRPLNYMFQSYALFPHLNVFDNLAFGIREKFNKNEINSEVKDISELLSIDNLLNRRIKQLSGGEQQRVALGRCLIKKPKLLLLDEPLAALDKKLRSKTQLELTSLQKQLKVTFVFVTHDQEEAMSLSDRMAIMREGKILECSSPEEVYENPKSFYTANFIGIANTIEVYKKSNHYFSNELNINLELKHEAKKQKTNILLRPEKIKIKSAKDIKINLVNSFEGVVLEKSYLGSFTRYEVKSGNKIISVLDQNYNSNSNYNFPIGERVLCSWEKESLKNLED